MKHHAISFLQTAQEEKKMKMLREKLHARVFPMSVLFNLHVSCNFDLCGNVSRKCLTQVRMELMRTSFVTKFHDREMQFATKK